MVYDVDFLNKVSDFRSRRKRKDRVAYGGEYTTFLAGCVSDIGFLKGLDVWDELAPVDCILKCLGIGLEAKRFGRTKYVTRAWLKEHVIDRFSEDKRVEFRRKVLCVTRKVWDSECDSLLDGYGIDVVSTGAIDTSLGRFRAKERFSEGFIEVVWEFVGSLFLEARTAYMEELEVRLNECEQNL